MRKYNGVIYLVFFVRPSARDGWAVFSYRHKKTATLGGSYKSLKLCKYDSGLTAKKMVIIKILIKYRNIKNCILKDVCLAACIMRKKQLLCIYLPTKVLIIPRPTKRKQLNRAKNKASIKIFPYLCTEFFHRFSFSLIDD